MSYFYAVCLKNANYVCTTLGTFHIIMPAVYFGNFERIVSSAGKLNKLLCIVVTMPVRAVNGVGTQS